MAGYLNTFKRHHHWRFHANRRYQWRFQSIKSENVVLTGASLQASAQQHCKDLGLQLFLHCSRHCCWRFQSQLSKSENAAGNGASLATCLVQLEGAIRTSAMHGQLREKGHPLGNISKTALLWEFLSKRTPNRKMCPNSTCQKRVKNRLIVPTYFVTPNATS